MSISILTSIDPTAVKTPYTIASNNRNLLAAVQEKMGVYYKDIGECRWNTGRSCASLPLAGDSPLIYAFSLHLCSVVLSLRRLTFSAHHHLHV